jgi:hypothetical protein
MNKGLSPVFRTKKPHLFVFAYNGIRDKVPVHGYGKNKPHEIWISQDAFYDIVSGRDKKAAHKTGQA